MSQKLDLFALLRALDQNSYEIYSAVSEDEDMKKELDNLIGWMLPLWMTGANNPKQMEELTERFSSKVNQVWDGLSEHPELRLKLLASCGLGRNTNHKFVKKSATRYNNSLYKLLMISHPDIRKDEVDIWIRKNDLDDLEQLAVMSGYQSKDIKELSKAFIKLKGELE